MSNDKKYSDIAQTINKANKLLIVAHENPDGDALGSITACAEYLQSLGKEFFLFCYNIQSDSFNFLTHKKDIKSQITNADLEGIDCAIIVDCASLKRTHIESEIRDSKATIVNIDHHISNDEFGDINVVEDDAVATTQILYDFFTSQKIVINKNMATSILTGILTDSGNFAYTATSPHTFDIASEMILKGANKSLINKETATNKDMEALKIWGVALDRFTYDESGDLAFTFITQADLVEHKANLSDLDGLSSFLNTTKDAKIILVLTELDDGRIKGSFRTNSNDIDVSLLAQTFGGGGHAKAAGFEVEGKFIKTIEGGYKIV